MAEKKQRKKKPTLKDQISELNSQVSDEKDKFLRLFAEFENYRKRTAKERLELFNVQYFTGDNSTVSFTLNANDIKPEGAAVFVDGVRKIAYSDYTISGTSLTFTLKPANNSSISVGQINKRYKNNSK